MSMMMPMVRISNTIIIMKLLLKLTLPAIVTMKNMKIIEIGVIATITITMMVIQINEEIYDWNH